MSLIISILWILLAIVILVGVFWLVVWVFEQLGLPLPQKALHLALVALVILVLIWLLTALVGGGGLSFPTGRLGHGSLMLLTPNMVT